uniref:Ig-like domain-containing protein n=1 Tax=Sphenodon punctatus TaxID=8508 RepID=A0A8D0H7B4_SPHPU
MALHKAGRLLASSSSRGSGASSPRLRASFSPNSLKLEIKEVGLEDEGTYVCSASNSIGEASASLSFTVETLRVAIKPAAEVREGDPVTLACEDFGAQLNTTYSWYKNTQWLAEGVASSLMLHAARASDAGSYSCRVQSERGSKTSLPAALHVLYAPRQPSLASFLETQDGRQAFIQCLVDSHPPSNLTLYRGTELVASSRVSEGSPTSTRLIHSAHNFLKVEMKEVTLEDEGRYLCSASNALGVSAASILFSIETVRLTISPSPDIQEGATVNLTCASQALGAANYTWYKNGKWLQDSPRRTLLLSTVSSVDAGLYHCRAEGRAGGATSAPVNLNVLYAPRNPSVSAFLENQDGKMGIIQCAVDSHPPSVLALYRGDELVACTHDTRLTSGRQVSVFPSYNSLRVEIWDVTPEDSARYTCLASNALGSVKAVSYFSVRTLSELRSYRHLAGVFIALSVIAPLLAVIAAIKLWPRIKEYSNNRKSEDSMELKDKATPAQVDNSF